MSEVLSMTAVASGDRLHVFAFTADGHVHHKWLEAGGWAPSLDGWHREPVMSGVIELPAAVSWGPGRIDLIGLTGRGELEHRWSKNGGKPGTWLDERPIGDRFEETPAVVSWGTQRLDLVGIRDGQVWHKFSAQDQWVPTGPGWTPIGGGDNRAVSLTTWKQGWLDVVALTGDDHYIHRWMRDGRTWSNPDSAWEHLGGRFTMAPVQSTGRRTALDVFAVASGAAPHPEHEADPDVEDVDEVQGRLLLRSSNGDRWITDTWERVDDLGLSGGGVLQRALFPPSVASRDRRMDVVVLNQDRMIVHRWMDNGRWNPEGWTDRGGDFTGPPVLASRGPGRLDLLGIDGSGVWHRPLDGSEAWQSLGLPAGAHVADSTR